MKKSLLVIALVLANFSLAFAQTDTVMYAPDLHNEWHYLCFNQHERAIVYAPNGCNDIHWLVNGVQYTDNPIILDGNVTDFYNCNFNGWNCGQFGFHIIFIQPNTPNESTTTLWKHEGYPLPIEPVGADSLEMYDFHWNTGETTPTIEVTAPGTYTCDISDQCATATRTFIVRDNVELYRATVDLETNLNKTTWQVTEEQAEYISSVKVYRDGLLVGTAPYEDGSFLDAIGSDNAARNYHIVGVTPEGEDCPIASYEKGTIHTTYYEDVNGNLNMTWNIPFVEEGANGTLTFFQICKYDPATGEITVVDQVNASITDYTCGVNQFDGGQAVIAAVFNDGKGVEELSFSNLTTDILGVEEDGPSTGSGTLTVYPNPANGTFTVAGASTLTVFNTLGQAVATSHSANGTHTFTLRPGIYFVKSEEGTVQKVVVE